MLDVEIDFKLVPSLAELDQLNRGDYGLSQVGKFITIYPLNDGAATSIASSVHQLTFGMIVPSVPSDFQYAPQSAVFYRYGIIGGHQGLGGETALNELLRPDGTTQFDSRNGLHPVPSWIENPFSYPKPSASTEGPGANLFAGRFIIVDSIRQRGGGGVYRAIELKRPSPDRQDAAARWAGRKVLLKEARFAGEMTGDGFSAQDRLRWQAGILRLLEDHPNFPNVIDLFEDEANTYLVLEHIDGKTLHEFITENADIDLQTVISIARSITEALSIMHRSNIYCCDLSPSNVILDHDQLAHLFDFDHAYCEGRPWSYQPGTPGFCPPGTGSFQVRDVATAAARDAYAVGSILHALIAPNWYAEILNHWAKSDRQAQEPAALPSNVPAEMRSLIDRARRAPLDNAPITVFDIARQLAAFGQAEL